MKKALFTILTSFIYLSMEAQDKSNLYGRWKIDYKGANETEITLTKAEAKSNELQRGGQWGRFIEFSQDGIYRENASAPCGMDDNRYSYAGKWSYNPKSKKIELSQIKVLRARPNIYNDYEVLSSGTLQVVSFDKKSFTLKTVKTWEKVAAKKEERSKE